MTKNCTNNESADTYFNTSNSTLYVDNIVTSKITPHNPVGLEIAGNIIPTIHNQFIIGKTTKQWKTVDSVFITTEDILTSEITSDNINSTNASLDTLMANHVTTTGLNSITAIANSLTATTVAATTVNSGVLNSTSVNSTNVKADILMPAVATTINLQGSLKPTSDMVYSLGTSSLRFNETHNAHNYELASITGTLFNSTSVASGSGAQVVSLTITNTPYDAGTGNQFKFPQKGYYNIAFMANWNVSGLLANPLSIMLYQFNTSSIQATHQEDAFLSIKPKMVSFNICVNDLLDRYQIRAQTSGLALSNFNITYGRLTLLSSYV